MNGYAKAALTALTVTTAGWTLVQNRMLSVQRLEVTLKNLPAGFEGKRILHLSDLHKKRYGEGFNNLINSCAFLEPDYIFFTGDLFSRTETDMEPKLVLMKRLMKLAPVYYVVGNHETDRPDRSQVLNEAMLKLGVHVLINSSEQITLGDEHINVIGTALPREHYRNTKGGFSGRMAVTKELLDRLVGRPEAGNVNLLLSHDPLPFEAYAEWGADLTFSGHVHGGVVRLPFVGGLLSPERRFFPKYTKGLYRIGEAQMAVSAGLGKFRLNNPSHVLLVTLRTEQS
ncbi:MAG: metallophosphoesterase [Ruminococcus sp.]|nr:metallophosphoesterase [Ruminococcus sp.]